MFIFSGNTSTKNFWYMKHSAHYWGEKKVVGQWGVEFAKMKRHFCVLKRTLSICYCLSILVRFQAGEVRDASRESLEATLMSSNLGRGRNVLTTGNIPLWWQCRECSTEDKIRDEETIFQAVVVTQVRYYMGYND